MAPRFFAMCLFGLLLVIPGVALGGIPTVETIDVGRGAVNVYFPSTYDTCEALPLIVSLHRFGGSSSEHEEYVNLLTQIESCRFICCIPDGTTDAQGNQFWNGAAACCDFNGSGVDDSGYLRDLIDAVIDTYSVDDRSVHCLGHSNGGFMSYRMACDHADIIASIVVLAGAMPDDPSVCVPSEAVSVLHMHGDIDTTIQYGGGCFGADCYASAQQSAEMWVGFNLCDPASGVNDPPVDVDGALPGTETIPVRYSSQCAGGSEVEFWTINGAGHFPRFYNIRAGEGPEDNRFAPLAVDWLLSHTKPAVVRPGDTNSDGAIDVNDISYVLLRLGQTTEDGDANGDGTVDVNDISYVLFRLDGAC